MKIVSYPSNSARKPPPQPSKPPGNCTLEEFQVLRNCYADYLARYDFDLGNNTLPHKTEKVFNTVYEDQANLCKNYASFTSCESKSAAHCITFESLQSLAGDDSDALYYLQQLARIELYCDHGKDYIRYMQCMDKIENNELQEIVYDECELNIQDNCQAVRKTVKCERGVISIVCDAKKSIDSYCTYQNLQMRRAAWNYCNDMPCPAPTAIIQILLFVIIVFVHLI